jgi:signal transduction histidine kinase
MPELFLGIAVLAIVVTLAVALSKRGRHRFKSFGLAFKAVALARRAKAMHARGIELEAAIADLESLYEKAKELDELKTQFFANVSHELRTPLALIIGPAGRMLSRHSLSDDDERDTELILRNARLLLKHVNDLLDISRLEAGKHSPAYVRTDVAKLVRVTASHFEGLAAERGTKFAVDTPPSLIAEIDPDKIRRVLLNLLSNAFKFTEAGRNVRASLSAPDEPEGRFVIEVADDGPGIRPEHRQLVFERFRQAEGGSSRRFGGTGLGLAIVKDFVELHAGTVSIHEAPEGGALFRVEIPVNAPAEAQVMDERPAPTTVLDDETTQALEELRARVDRAAPAEHLEKPLVLVVEDNRDMNRFVCDSLEPTFRTEQAFDGTSGFQQALSSRPDLVLSDIMMPGMSGEELTRRVRERRELDSTPIMLLTAKTDDDLRVRLLDEGAQDFLMKPFSPQELRARVTNLITMKRARGILQSELDSSSRDVDRLATQIIDQKRELQTAVTSMRVAREHAERATKLKSSFLSMVSHELRTPLASLMLQIERMQLGEPLPPDKRDLMRRMSSSAARLSGLIEGLLRYAQVESGLSSKRERIELGPLIRGVIDELAPHAEQKGLALSLKDGAASPLESDPELIRLIALNLVQNAIKFTERGSVTVSLDHHDGAYRITVADTGPGIPPELRPRIFEPFVQGEDIRNKHHAGVGLGLALVREMTISVGGSILLDSELGRGSRFTVVLPQQSK